MKNQEKKLYKSAALEALHESVSDLHRLGLVDDKTKRRFDRSCLVSSKEPKKKP